MWKGLSLVLPALWQEQWDTCFVGHQVLKAGLACSYRLRHLADVGRYAVDQAQGLSGFPERSGGLAGFPLLVEGLSEQLRPGVPPEAQALLRSCL